MTHREMNDNPQKGSSSARPQQSDTPKQDSGHTKVGQEAARGVVPAEHDREHESNYGGGGENGGA